MQPRLGVMTQGVWSFVRKLKTKRCDEYVPVRYVVLVGVPSKELTTQLRSAIFVF